MFSKPAFLALLSLQGVAAFPTERTAQEVVVQDVEAFASEAELIPAENVVGLAQSNIQARSSRALLSGLAKNVKVPVKSVEGGSGYGIEVKIGDQTFTEIFDTGSSDLWVAKSPYTCVGPQMHKHPTADCGFGKFFSGGFTESKLANQNFNISYGDGEFVTGTLGTEKVSVAGITIDRQEFALVDYGFFVADKVISGIMGFAYPSLTSAYKGTNPHVDSDATNLHYTTWVFNAMKQKKIANMFSLALLRGGAGSQLALGGLPTLKFDHTFTSTPLKMIELTPHAIEKTKFSYYTIIPDGVTVGGDMVAGSHAPAIVDSGTTLLYLPDRVAEAINAAFDPPSQFVEAEGIFENDCDATPPPVAVRIAGKEFNISPHELLLPGRDPSTGGCVVGIQPNGGGPSILGDVFLKNVVAVYDVGAAVMKFAPHENY